MFPVCLFCLSALAYTLWKVNTKTSRADSILVALSTFFICLVIPTRVGAQLEKMSSSPSLVAASPTRDHEYIVIVALTAFSGRVLLVVSPNEDGK
jgi:hypothetical protein